jgi:hypothetical protein
VEVLRGGRQTEDRSLLVSNFPSHVVLPR